MSFRAYSDPDSRRKGLEKFLNIELKHVGKYSINVGLASAKNCENMIGVTQMPIGIAGPLKIKSKLQNREIFVPLTTTEGALVASVNRGAKAINQGGGANIISKKVGITRAPVFVVKNINEGEKVIEWLSENFTKIQKITESTSSHLKLLEVKPLGVGKNIFLRFKFDTQDAMGMNMVTIASTIAADYIEKNTKAKLISISGNFCVDKKPNTLNFIEGRGIQVQADCVISREDVAEILKTTPEKFAEVVVRKVYLGSIVSGSIGANSHAANVLAAIFAATGQDLAHLAEIGSVVTTAEVVAEGLYISVFIPDLVVGTVGGGTGLGTQKEALSILGVFGGNKGKNSQKFAEIIGGAVLAGEISLIASLSENSLAKAHRKLGRGEKT
jgi:hydroxymethylglutaryl-CoA reductase (NADPH)